MNNKKEIHEVPLHWFRKKKKRFSVTWLATKFK